MNIDEDSVKKNAIHIERAAWLLVLLGMLTQLSSSYAFPSYNVVLGFWGAYSVFTIHGKSVFGFIVFLVISILLDIVYCSTNEHDSDTFRFSLSMLILCIFIKAYALYYSCHFFTAIGGAYSIDANLMLRSVNSSPLKSTTTSSTSGIGIMGRSVRHPYAKLGESTEALGGGYFPPDASPQSSQIFEASESNANLRNVSMMNSGF